MAGSPRALTQPTTATSEHDVKTTSTSGSAFDPLPFDGEATRAFGRVYAAVTAPERQRRGARAVDLLIAATAVAADLPSYTRNIEDARGLEQLVTLVAI